MDMSVCGKTRRSPLLSETELTHSPVTRKYAEFPKMAEQGPMAIAMRLRNQLQNVYKLDPLRNEVSERGENRFSGAVFRRALPALTINARERGVQCGAKPERWSERPCCVSAQA